MCSLGFGLMGLSCFWLSYCFFILGAGEASDSKFIPVGQAAMLKAIGIVRAPVLKRRLNFLCYRDILTYQLVLFEGLTHGF